MKWRTRLFDAIAVLCVLTAMGFVGLNDVAGLLISVIWGIVALRIANAMETYNDQNRDH